MIGLDGVPHWLLRRLASDGVLPTVAALLPQGTLRPLVAPVPEISSTSWASFLTGTDPGRHGVYGFIDLRPGEYRTFFPNLRDLKSPPLWRFVDETGDPSLIINVPGTFPAPRLRGALVSGFVAPDLDRAVYPPELVEPLRAAGYQLDVEVGDVAHDPHGFLDRVEAALNARRAAFRYLLDHHSWRLAVCVITETDRVHHFLWRDLMEPGSPLHGRILDFYRQVDTAIAELVERAGDGGLVMVSDHGFGPANTQFYINSWLRVAGYLGGPPEAGSLDELDETTAAFALDPGRVYVNVAGRFPRGRQFTGESLRALLDEITGRLLRLRIGPAGVVAEGGPGEPVIVDVLRGTELYYGPRSADAPDLVAMPAPGVQIRGAWSQPGSTARSPLTGTHTRADAMFWSRGDKGHGDVHMRDVAPTVLATMAIIPPLCMEGVDVRNIATLSEDVTINSTTGKGIDNCSAS